MKDASLLGWPFLTSLGVHVAGLAAVSSIVSLAPSTPIPSAIPIEIVRAEAPPEPPKPKERIVPPRLTTRARELAAPVPVPLPLREEPRRRESVPTDTRGGAPDTRLFASSGGAGDPIPGLAAAGRIFAKGDLLLPGGVARVPQETIDGGGALTDFARPLGGYQTEPRYPDLARRQGIEGVTTLRFQVLTSGRVGNVAVARSAGHTSLDRAAVEAVKTWLFEPARRGKEPIAVWVTLPVRFQLQAE
jgi:protein TonB